jgi:uncharacterized membrane protein YjgN (DUF898 family)
VSYQPAPGQQPYVPQDQHAQQPYPQTMPTGPARAQFRQFAFDGGAGTYFGTALLAFLITVFTLGLCYPFGLVLRERWRAKHSYIEGRQLAFNGSAWGLFGLWWKWLILIIITIGIYSFWVGPRIYRWKWEHTSWAQQVPGYFGAVRG